MVAERSSSELQAHRSHRSTEDHSDENYGECVVAIHVPPIKGTAKVKFKVLDGTEPILSMPMLVANGNKVVFRGEDDIDHGGMRNRAVDKY